MLDRYGDSFILTADLEQTVLVLIATALLDGLQLGISPPVAAKKRKPRVRMSTAMLVQPDNNIWVCTVRSILHVRQIAIRLLVDPLQHRDIGVFNGELHS